MLHLSNQNQLRSPLINHTYIQRRVIWSMLGCYRDMTLVTCRWVRNPMHMGQLPYHLTHMPLVWVTLTSFTLPIVYTVNNINRASGGGHNLNICKLFFKDFKLNITVAYKQNQPVKVVIPFVSNKQTLFINYQEKIDGFSLFC